MQKSLKTHFSNIYIFFNFTHNSIHYCQQIFESMRNLIRHWACNNNIVTNVRNHPGFCLLVCFVVVVKQHIICIYWWFLCSDSIKDRMYFNRWGAAISPWALRTVTPQLCSALFSSKLHPGVSHWNESRVGYLHLDLHIVIQELKCLYFMWSWNVCTINKSSAYL